MRHCDAASFAVGGHLLGAVMCLLEDEVDGVGRACAEVVADVAVVLRERPALLPDALEELKSRDDFVPPPRIPPRKAFGRDVALDGWDSVVPLVQYVTTRLHSLTAQVALLGGYLISALSHIGVAAVQDMPHVPDSDMPFKLGSVPGQLVAKVLVELVTIWAGPAAVLSAAAMDAIMEIAAARADVIPATSSRQPRPTALHRARRGGPAADPR